MDGDAPFVVLQFVDPDDHTCHGAIEWTAGLEIARHIDPHARGVMTCGGGKI